LKPPILFRDLIPPFDNGSPKPHTAPPFRVRRCKAVRRIRSRVNQAVHLTSHGLGIPLSEVGFPIRKFTDQSFFAAPRDLSQRSTSFIASQRQGIHRTPLRHLIALIINAHSPRQVTAQTPSLSRGSSSSLGTDRKTSLLRDRSAKACGQARLDMGVGRSSSLRTTADRSPLHDVRQPASRDRGSTRHKNRCMDESQEAMTISDQPRSTQSLVEPDGIEPTTSCLQSRRSPS
jgi:hypothetical protein